MQGIYPEVGMRGSVEMDAPYDKLIVAGVQYTCIAVESIPGLLISNTPVYQAYYAAQGVDRSVYETDLLEHNKIVSFQASEGDIISVPNSFIRSLPNANGVPYQALMLSLSLAAMPDEYDLDPLIEELQQVILVRTGIESHAKVVSYGPSVLLTGEQHAAMVAYRNDKATNKFSYLLQVEKAERENELLKKQLAELVGFIESKWPPA
jgi:hypothetical protein